MFWEYRQHFRTFHQARPDTLNFVPTKFFRGLSRGQDSQNDSVWHHLFSASPAYPTLNFLCLLTIKRLRIQVKLKKDTTNNALATFVFIFAIYHFMR